MPTRTTRTIVHFRAPFSIAGMDAVQAPGDYAVEHDEEQIEGLSRIAYRRVATLMHIPAIGAAAATSQVIALDPDDLRAALEKDAAPQSNADTDPSSAAG